MFFLPRKKKTKQKQQQTVALHLHCIPAVVSGQKAQTSNSSPTLNARVFSWKETKSVSCITCIPPPPTPPQSMLASKLREFWNNRKRRLQCEWVRPHHEHHQERKKLASTLVQLQPKTNSRTRRDKEGKILTKTSSNPEKFGVDVSVLSQTRQSPIFFRRGDSSGEEDEATESPAQPSHPHDDEEEERPGAPEARGGEVRKRERRKNQNNNQKKNNATKSTKKKKQPKIGRQY